MPGMVARPAAYAALAELALEFAFVIGLAGLQDAAP
jgi:hypothetical protein